MAFHNTGNIQYFVQTNNKRKHKSLVSLAFYAESVSLSWHHHGDRGCLVLHLTDHNIMSCRLMSGSLFKTSLIDHLFPSTCRDWQGVTVFYWQSNFWTLLSIINGFGSMRTWVFACIFRVFCQTNGKWIALMDVINILSLYMGDQYTELYCHICPY